MSRSGPTLAIAVAGAGRMGQSIATLVEQQSDLELTGIWSRGGDLDSLVADADVVVDFSLPEGTMQVIDAVVKAGKPLVCGVSGLDETQAKALSEAARSIPLLYDRNMSQGIAALAAVMTRVAASLGPEFAASVEETHHVHKKDAPSGTAIMLSEALAAARSEQPADIPVRSERRGEVPGDHSVNLSTARETITLSHSVTSRDVFAEGAIRAARWLVDGRNSGLYSMKDVLFGED